MRIALAILPPLFLAGSVYAIVWGVEPTQLRDRAVHVMALLFSGAMALGELTAWLAQ
jgi:hypothetical protein